MKPPGDNKRRIEELLAQVKALCEELKDSEGKISPEELQKLRFNMNPFEETGRSLAQALELEALLEAAMTPEAKPQALLELADTKAEFMELIQLLRSDWQSHFSETYPPSN